MRFNFAGSSDYHYKGSLGSALVSFSSKGLQRVHFVTVPEPVIQFGFYNIDEITLRDLEVLPLLDSNHEVYLALEGKEVNPIQLDLIGTDFQKKVWNLLLNIKPGWVSGYKAIAVSLGKPTAFRVVANACGANNIAVIVPCHRVRRSDGKIGGYKWGTDLKKFLLDRELKQYKGKIA